MSLFGPPSAPDRFATILNGCGKALGLEFHVRWSDAPLYWLIWGRLQGAIRRFVSLACRFREGRLKPPRPRPAARAEDQPARVRKADKFPRRREGWVVHLGGHHVAAYRSQLEWFLAHDAEVARLMAADPYRMRRILRPLCHMLGAQLPECLRQPVPRPAPPPAVAAPEVNEPTVNGGAAEAGDADTARPTAPRPAPLADPRPAPLADPRRPTAAAPLLTSGGAAAYPGVAATA
jgi:hypothetical protein